MASTFDRANWQASLGLYWVCVQAFSTFTADVKVSENNFYQKFENAPNALYNYHIGAEGYYFYTFNDKVLKSQWTTISIEVSSLDARSPLEVFYKLCLAEPCEFDSDGARGLGPSIKLNLTETTPEGESADRITLVG